MGGLRIYNCKACGIERTPQFIGNYCKKCNSQRVLKRYYKRKSNQVSPYSVTYWTIEEACNWIERTIQMGGTVDFSGLNDLITVYYSIGGSDYNDGLDNYSTREQLMIMWEKCLAYHSERQKMIFQY